MKTTNNTKNFKKQNMKTNLKKMMIACLLGLGLATTGMAANNPTEEISRKIQSSVSLPKEFKNPGFTENVKVFFTVDEKGNVNHEIAATNNNILRKAIEAQFKQLSFAGLSPKVSYNIELKFIVQ